jgi:hypothetical protein
MSVWPKTIPATPSLSGREGVLVLVSIHIDARHLELLLEALAQVSFPVNPQIYHDAVMVYRHADGHEHSEPITMVDFPAYEGHLGQVRHALESYGFDPAAIQITAMLDEIHAAAQWEPAPPGAGYSARRRLKRPQPVAAAPC